LSRSTSILYDREGSVLYIEVEKRKTMIRAKGSNSIEKVNKAGETNSEVDAFIVRIVTLLTNAIKYSEPLYPTLDVGTQPL